MRKHRFYSKRQNLRIGSSVLLEGFDANHARKSLRLKKNGVEVKYYEGKDGLRYVYDQVMKASEYSSFADLEKYYNLFSDIDVSDWNSLYEKNPEREAWDILVDSELARKIAKTAPKKYHVKFLPKKDFFKGFDFADYIFFGDYVAIVQLDPENPLATLIKSEHISKSLKALHTVMWDLLPEGK